MKLFGLIGFPLAHSFSKGYFSDKFANENIDAEYRNFEIESIDSLPDLIANTPELLGFNVTIPHKRNILKYLDGIEPVAKKIGAVNVVLVKRSESDYSLWGYNTDVIGFSKSLESLIGSVRPKTLILGSGGSSMAVRNALEGLKMEYMVISRNPEEGSLTYSDINRSIIENYHLIINTTPVGMFPRVDNAPDLPYKYLDSRNILFDLVYNPEQTVFLKRGMEKGCRVKGGLDMLHIQAEEAWEIWSELI